MKLSGSMDPQVLINALSIVMGHEEKELCKFGHLAMQLILETATAILGDKERVSEGFVLMRREGGREGHRK